MQTQSGVPYLPLQDSSPLARQPQTKCKQTPAARLSYCGSHDSTSLITELLSSVACTDANRSAHGKLVWARWDKPPSLFGMLRRLKNWLERESRRCACCCLTSFGHCLHSVITYNEVTKHHVKRRHHVPLSSTYGSCVPFNVSCT